MRQSSNLKFKTARFSGIKEEGMIPPCCRTFGAGGLGLKKTGVVVDRRRSEDEKVSVEKLMAFFQVDETILHREGNAGLVILL